MSLDIFTLTSPGGDAGRPERHSSMRKLMRAVLGERMALLMLRSLRSFCPSALSRISCCTRAVSLDACSGTVTFPQALLFICE